MAELAAQNDEAAIPMPCTSMMPKVIHLRGMNRRCQDAYLWSSGALRRVKAR